MTSHCEGADLSFLHCGRLGAMSTKRSLDGGPKRAPRSSTEGAGPLMAELYQHRERLQLGLDFHVTGNLHNWTREWTDAVLPTPRISATTRMMCWNAGGGAGTLKDDDKLRFLTLTMLQQRIHVACLTEGRARCKDLQAALRRIGMSAHFIFFWRAVSLPTPRGEGPHWPGGRRRARE